MELTRKIEKGKTCNPCSLKNRNVRAIEFCLHEEECGFEVPGLGGKQMGKFCRTCVHAHREVFANHEVLRDWETAQKRFKSQFKVQKKPTETYGRGDIRRHNGGQTYNNETLCNFALTIVLDEEQNKKLNPEMWRYKVVQYYDHNCEYIPIKWKPPNLNNIAMSVILMENNLLEISETGLTQAKMKQAIRAIIGYEPNNGALCTMKKFMLDNSPKHKV